MNNFYEIFDYPVYEVGGCVRDEFLGVPVKDIDLASDLTPTAFKARCERLRFRTYDTGIKHGTVSVMIKGTLYEHTTFRQDVSCDGRNATIEYAKTIEEDLARRDFTINAMAKLGGTIIDPFNGRQDLLDRKLRTVGAPHERFCEDYLRLVRAARFMAKLDLTADEELMEAARKLAPGLRQYVSVERILDEIKKAQSHGSQFLREAAKLSWLTVLFPELKGLDDQQKESWLIQVARTKTKSELVYLAAILVPIYGDQAASKAVELRSSRYVSQGMSVLERYGEVFTKKLAPGELRDLMVAVKAYYEDLKDFSHIRYADEVSVVENIREATAMEEEVERSITSPFIKGDYLIAAGLKPSARFKDILTHCGRLQAAGAAKKEVVKVAQRAIKDS